MHMINQVASQLTSYSDIMRRAIRATNINISYTSYSYIIVSPIMAIADIFDSTCIIIPITN